MGSSTVTVNPAGLTSRIRLERVWNYRNWDMLFAAPLRLAVTEVPTYSTVQGEYTGVWRTTKDSGPSHHDRAVQEISKSVIGIIVTESLASRRHPGPALGAKDPGYFGHNP